MGRSDSHLGGMEGSPGGGSDSDMSQDQGVTTDVDCAFDEIAAG